MKHSILCTNQARYNGLVVDDVPPMVDVTNSSTHSIFFPSSDVRLPQHMHGPVSHLHVRYPTDWDMDHYDHLHLTDGDSLWDPSLFNDANRINSISYDSDPVVRDMMQDDLFDRMINSVNTSSITRVTKQDVLPLSICLLCGILGWNKRRAH